MGVDGVEVAALRDGLRRDAPLPRRRQRAFEKVLAKIDVRVLRHQVGGDLHIAGRELIAFAYQQRQLTDDAVDLIDAGRVPFDHQLVTLRTNPDAERGLELLQVLVVRAEQRLDAVLRHGDAFRGHSDFRSPLAELRSRYLLDMQTLR